MGARADYAAVEGPPEQHRWVVVIVTTFSDEPLTVYGDESHDEQRQRVSAVAGLLGDKSDWDGADQSMARLHGRETLSRGGVRVRVRKPRG